MEQLDIKNMNAINGRKEENYVMELRTTFLTKYPFYKMGFVVLNVIPNHDLVGFPLELQRVQK